MRSSRNRNSRDTRETRRWYRMDLHLHTPASADFREPNVTYLDFLKKADEKGLDIIAFADHNTVAGYSRYMAEFESLELLERLNRLTPEERKNLAEFRRLRDKLLILPGFEFTATLGFHILCMFPPDTTVRRLEHLLLTLRVPPDRLDEGSTECGATSDVLTVYRIANEAGGLVIAAHANSSHGVAMPGFDFGGQTRIAYTQDPHLHALEVTDFASKSRRRTQLFFNGTKPEYPRRMHVIQSSDSHRLTGLPNNNQELGVGDRSTEIYLDVLSFDAIKSVFLGNDFALTRPYIPAAKHAFDPIYAAREEGETLVQTFHEHLLKNKTINRSILEDMVALANTNGGTIYVGVSANPRVPPVGVDRPAEAVARLRTDLQRLIVPPLEVQLDAQKTDGKNVLRVIVPRGSEVPYALDGSYIYVRQENETNLAVRDEIIQLVRESLSVELAAMMPEPEPAVVVAVEEEEPVLPAPEPSLEEARPALAVAPPRTGVQVVASENRKGTMYYTIRDLRNNRAVHNITRSSARKLWQYAISEFEDHPVDPAQVKWQGSIGLVKSHKRAGKMRYDLVERGREKNLGIYYGVTEDGIHGPWRNLLEAETPAEEEALSETASVAEADVSWGPEAPVDESESDVRAPAPGMELEAELGAETLPPYGEQETSRLEAVALEPVTDELATATAEADEAFPETSAESEQVLTADLGMPGEMSGPQETASPQADVPVTPEGEAVPGGRLPAPLVPGFEEIIYRDTPIEERPAVEGPEQAHPADHARQSRDAEVGLEHEIPGFPEAEVPGLGSYGPPKVTGSHEPSAADKHDLSNPSHLPPVDPSVLGKSEEHPDKTK